MVAAWAWEIGVGPVFPRVPVETPAPPVLGKEMLAGLSCLFPFLIFRIR
jgi:hypothetical protein